MKKLLFLGLLLSCSFAHSEALTVTMTKNISSVTTQDSGKKIKIIRVQDTKHKLVDDFAKTSRACPPFCIQPTKADKNIDTIAELEVFKFMENQIKHNKGLLIDARLKSWFELETIPSALNMPYRSMLNESKEAIKKIFKLLGMTIETNGEWNFDDVKELIIFDNGPWCAQATHLIKALKEYHYPTSKIHYYRAGLQGWKLLGLTTVVHKEIREE